MLSHIKNDCNDFLTVRCTDFDLRTKRALLLYWYSRFLELRYQSHDQDRKGWIDAPPL